MIFEKETNRQKYSVITQYLKDTFNDSHKEEGGDWTYVNKYIIGFQDSDYFCVKNKDRTPSINVKLLWFYTSHIKSFEINVENSMILINNMVAIKYDI